MSVFNFIKENRVLVAGLVLPLLLIGVFTMAKSLPSALTKPPVYKFVFFSSQWTQKGQLDLKVDESGHLAADFKKNEGYKATPNDPQPAVTIYIYDPKTNIVHDTKLTLDKNDKLPELDKFSDLKLSKEQTSPDGYIYEQYHYRNNSLITDIFSYRSYDSGPVLSKNNYIVKLPVPKTDYNNKEFLGWVIEGDVK